MDELKHGGLPQFLNCYTELKKFSFVKEEILPVEPLFYNVHVLSLGKTFNLSPSWFLHL